MHSSLKRHRGVSKKMIIHRSRIGGRDMTVITAGKQDEHEAEARKRRRAAIRGGSFKHGILWVKHDKIS